MYQALGITNLLKIIFYLNALIAAALVANLGGVWTGIPFLRAASLAVFASTSALLLIGETPLFPWICRLPLLWHVFPNLDGRYEVEIASNWSIIEAKEKGVPLEGLPDDPQTLFEKTGTITIKARLFSTTIHLEMDDKYTTSETISVSIRKEKGAQNAALNYIYCARTKDPLRTDTSQHFGAAHIDIPSVRTIPLLEGNYWTDRNWKHARNTAGRITLRPIPRRSRA